jgi:hypothetical protein
MLNLKIGDNLSLDIKTEFGIIVVDFTVVHKLIGNHYALIAQDKLVVVNELPSGDFIMSEAVDLLDMEPVDYKICSQTY